MSEVRVDLVTNSGQSVQAVGSLESKVDELAKSHAQLHRESQRAVQATVGSYAALERELKASQKELKNLAIGSKEFSEKKAEVDALTEAMQKAKSEIGSTNAATGSLAGRVGSAVKEFATTVIGFGTVLGGVTALLQLVGTELQEAKRRDSESNTVVKSREQALVSLITNAGGDLADKIVEQAEAVEAITGASADKLIGVSSAVASAGVTDPTQIVDIAQMALRSQGGDQASAQAIAGAAIDLSNTLGITVKEAFGTIFQSSGVARPEDIAQLGVAAVRATAALRSVGVESEKAQEIFAATTLLTGDKSGQQAVSVAGDLRAAFEKLQTEGVPKSIEVAGKDVAVKLSEEQRAALTAPGQTLTGVLEMAQQDAEVAKLFQGLLPNSQNVAFTRQIVANDPAFADKLAQASAGIDLASAGARAGQQVADVEGRRPVGVLAEQVQAQIQQNALDRGAALRGEARAAFDAVLERTDTIGFDASKDFFDRRDAEAREALGTGTATARADVLRRMVEDEQLSGRDALTATQVAKLLDSMQRLIDKAEKGELTPREANLEQGRIRDELQSLQIVVRPELRPAEAQVPAAALSE